MANRATTWVGVAAAAGVGYYFYQAGGDPKLAQKKVETDAAKVSSAVKDQIPGQAKKLQKEGEEGLQSAKSHLSALGNDIKAEGRKAEAKLNAAASDAHAQATKAVDAFDKNVNEGTAKAKSGISSWFGGK